MKDKAYTSILSIHLVPAMVQNIKITAKNVKITTTIYHGDVYTARDARTGKMQLPAFTGCIDLHLTYFRCSALALPVNIVSDIFYVSTDLRKSGCQYYKGRDDL
jgi:hypothetical protein